MKLRVRVVTSQWAWSDPDEAVVLPGGDHALPSADVKVTADLVKALAGAVRAGAVEILEADTAAKKALAGAVEKDTDSLKAQARAMESGKWLKGHLEDYVAQADAVKDGTERALKDVDYELARDDLSAEERGALEARRSVVVAAAESAAARGEHATARLAEIAGEEA